MSKLITITKDVFRRILPNLMYQEISKIISILNNDQLKYKDFNYTIIRSQKKITNKKIIILGLRTFYYHNLSVFEKVLSDSLINKGACVKNLICNNVLDSCDANSFLNEKTDKETVCINCKQHRKQFMKKYNSKFLFFNEFISKDKSIQIKNDIDQLSKSDLLNYKLDRFDLSKYAIESVCKYFRISELDINNIILIKELRFRLTQATICFIVAKNLYKKELPSHIITLHGVYVSWGIISDYMRSRGVTVIVYQKSIDQIGNFQFFRNKWANDIIEKREWDKFNLKPCLDKEESSILKKYFESKINGTHLMHKIYFDNKANNDKNNFLNKYQNIENKYVFMPNLMWDIGLETAKSNTFSNLKDFISKVIDFFICNPDLYLVIKPHPAETTPQDKTINGVKSYILSKFHELPNNISFIPNDLTITAYDLGLNNFIGITYNGTIGLEFAYLKFPIIVGGNIHYTNAGCHPRIIDIDHFYSLIINPDKVVNYFIVNNKTIEKYCYYYFTSISYRIPFFSKKEWMGHCINWEAMKSYDKFINSNVIMQKLADDIMYDKPLIGINS